jgi:hypothetical protein
MTSLSAFYFSVAIGLIGLTWAECPADCVCMWKNGKETTECINKDQGPTLLNFLGIVNALD